MIDSLNNNGSIQWNLALHPFGFGGDGDFRSSRPFDNRHHLHGFAE